MLGNLEIKKKPQNQVRTQANAQPPFQKLIFSNEAQKLHKSTKFCGFVQFFSTILLFSSYFIIDCSSCLKSFKGGKAAVTSVS